VSRIRNIGLICAAFFGALLLIYRFDFGMAVAAFATAAALAVVTIIGLWSPP
jgi:hypothetical protein